MTATRSKLAPLVDEEEESGKAANPGLSAAHMMSHAMLQGLQMQQSLAMLWLGVGAEMAAFLVRVGDQQAKTWTAPAARTGNGAAPIQIAGATSAALEEYFTMSSRVMERSNATSRQIAGLWTRYADEMKSTLSSGSHSN